MGGVHSDLWRHHPGVPGFCPAATSHLREEPCPLSVQRQSPADIASLASLPRRTTWCRWGSHWDRGLSPGCSRRDTITQLSLGARHGASDSQVLVPGRWLLALPPGQTLRTRDGVDGTQEPRAGSFLVLSHREACDFAFSVSVGKAHWAVCVQTLMTFYATVKTGLLKLLERKHTI